MNARKKRKFHNRQSREHGNIRYTRPRAKTKTIQKANNMSNINLTKNLGVNSGAREG
jgi:hypothetical protein